MFFCILSPTLTGEVFVSGLFWDAVSVLAAVVLPGKRRVLLCRGTLCTNISYRSCFCFTGSPEHESSFLGSEMKKIDDT